MLFLTLRREKGENGELESKEESLRFLFSGSLVIWLRHHIYTSSINRMLTSKNKFGLFLLLIFLFIGQQSNGQSITNNQTGINNGFYYSFWSDRNSGSAAMILGPNGNYKTVWSNIGNFTAGKGWMIGKADRVIRFSGSFDGGKNGYLAVYGWTRNPLIEYYVVENYGDWVPPGGKSKGTFSSDGETYNIYQTTRNNQPSIAGNQTFQQYWSVRKTKRSSGTVTFANHVAAWKSKGMNLGNHLGLSDNGIRRI